jgi:hypothetical protein
VRITPHQLSALVQQLWQTADDEFLCLGTRPCRFGIFPLMARQALYGSTLRSVLRRSCHFYNLVSEAVEFGFEEWDDRARLSLRLTDPSLDTEHSLCEFLLLIWHRFPGWMIGRRVELSRMCFTHARPPHAAEYRLMFPAPVAYEQPFNGFEFSRDQLDAPIVQTVANLRSYMKRAPLDWFSRQAYYPIYTRRVLDQLERADSLASTSIEDTATALHMTSRTLRRTLRGFEPVKWRRPRPVQLVRLNPEGPHFGPRGQDTPGGGLPADRGRAEANDGKAERPHRFAPVAAVQNVGYLRSGLAPPFFFPPPPRG